MLWLILFFARFGLCNRVARSGYSAGIWWSRGIPPGASEPQKPHNYGLFQLPWPRKRSRRRPRKRLPSGVPPMHCTASLDVPGDVAMNVNGKAELIMIKFVIPNKSINWNLSWFQFWYRICCSLIIGYRINASPSVASLCISTAVIWEFSYVL